MSNKTKYVFLVIITLSCFSCQNSDLEKEKALLQFLENSQYNYTIGSDFKYYIIIPENGCSACIREGKRFTLENLNSPLYTFIFIEHSSVKKLNIELRINISDYQNILFEI